MGMAIPVVLFICRDRHCTNVQKTQGCIRVTSVKKAIKSSSRREEKGFLVDVVGFVANKQSPASYLGSGCKEPQGLFPIPRIENVTRIGTRTSPHDQVTRYGYDEELIRYRLPTM